MASNGGAATYAASSSGRTAEMESVSNVLRKLTGMKVLSVFAMAGSRRLSRDSLPLHGTLCLAAADPKRIISLEKSLWRE